MRESLHLGGGGSMRWLLAVGVVIPLLGASEALAFARPATMEGEHDMLVPAGVRFDRTFEWRAAHAQTPALLARTVASLRIAVDGSATEGWDGETESREERGLRVETTAVVNGENATSATLHMLSAPRWAGRWAAIASPTRGAPGRTTSSCARMSCTSRCLISRADTR